MNTGGEAAEQIVRMSLEGFEVAAKITGAGAKNIAILLYSILKEEKKTKGKARLTSMLRSGKELKVFTVKNGDLKKFTQEAKKYGVLYCVLSVYNNPEDIYYYIAVSSNIPVPEGMVEYMIPEGMWVVFENDGVFKEDVQSVFRRFLTEFLPFSGYEYAGLPDVEIYPVCKGQPSKGHSEVWIAIKKAKEI